MRGGVNGAETLAGGQTAMLDRRLLVLSVLASAAASAARADSEPGDRKKGGGAAFVQIPTLTATIVRPSGGRGVMTVEAGLDIQVDRLRARAQASIPRLRAAYAQALQVYAAGLPPAAPPSPDQIGDALQRQTDQVLGRPGARLLLGSILSN